jgi:hypothetical protein
MRVIERPFSDLLRRPKEVSRDVADHDVLLRRRGAPALRLTRADRDDDRLAVVTMFGRALHNLAVHQPATLGEALLEEFPWSKFLPVSERRTFLEEVTTTLVGAAELDNFAPLAQLLREWKATAEIHADPRLARRLRRPVEAAGKRIPAPA